MDLCFCPFHIFLNELEKGKEGNPIKFWIKIYDRNNYNLGIKSKISGIE